MRTTRKQLDALCDTLNRVTNSPLECYTPTANGRSVANVGHFHISGAYGGYCVHRMANESGGVTTPIMSGHIPAAQCAELLRAFIAGVRFASQA